MRPRLRANAGAACIAVVVALALVACGGAGERVPGALEEYLEALVEGRIAEAFERSQLAELEAFARGGALSRQHFTAFYQAHPLLEYRVEEVVRLDRRDASAPAEPGTPEWDVRVRLSYAFGSVVESFGVQGAVLGRVIVDPVPIDVRLPTASVPELSVDGVAVDVTGSAVGRAGSTFRLVVLNGRHELLVNDRAVTFTTRPLTVLSGPARATGEPESALPQTLVIAS